MSLDILGKIAPPPKRQKLDQIQSGITIGIDMSFDELMLEKVPIVPQIGTSKERQNRLRI